MYVSLYASGNRLPFDSQGNTVRNDDRTLEIYVTGKDHSLGFSSLLSPVSLTVRCTCCQSISRCPTGEQQHNGEYDKNYFLHSIISSADSSHSSP